MKKNLFKLLFVMLFVLTVSFTFVYNNNTNVLADETETEEVVEPSLNIYKKNISYASEIYIMYAVSYEGIDVTTTPVKMLFYNSVQDEYTTQTASYVASSQGSVNIGGVSCQIFASNGLAAKQMTDDIYARAYVEIDGQTIYSEVVKYSVLEYYYEIKEAGTVSTNILNLLEAMVNYGAAAQINFNYNTEKLANATYYKVSVENAVLPDGFTSGRFQYEEQVTLTAPEKEGYVFKNWTNVNDEVVSTDVTYTLTVTQDETLTANYEEEVAVTPVTLTLTKETAYDATASTLDLPSTVTFDYNSETVTENVIWDTASFIVNQIGKQKLYGTLSNDTYKVNELSIEIDVLPYTFSLDETNIKYSITKYYGNKNEVVIPSKFNNVEINEIGEWAFEEYKGTSITIPSSVTSIEIGAFYDCTAEIIWDNPTITEIGYGSFLWYRGTSITIPSSVTSIGLYAFEECVAEIIWDDTMITEIGSSAFGCYRGTNITIPSSVTSIGEYAFFDCKHLTNITIPSSVTSIEIGAFCDCWNLKNIYYDGTEEEWNNIEINSDDNDYLLNATIHFKEKELNIEIFEENGICYLYLGKYPQTVETDSNVISNLDNITTTNSLGYIEYNGAEYKKVTANPYESNYTFINKSSIVKGNTYYFKVEPIKWRILELNDGTYKLLSDMILDNTEFYQSTSNRTINDITIYANNYEYSNIRAWLNGYDGTTYDVDDYTNKGFIDIAFTEEERKLINSTLVDNSLASTGDSENLYGCNNTTDKIYLLSYADVTNTNYGFDDYDTRCAIVSDYGRSNYCRMTIYTHLYGNGDWVLRSPNCNYGSYVHCVSYGGSIGKNLSVKKSYYGVRAALEITIK